MSSSKVSGIFQLLPFRLPFKRHLSEFVYGGIDGSITTFAVVSGGTGAVVAPSIIIIMGIANLLADGLSMSVGSYLSARTARENYLKIRNSEYTSIITEPESEVNEVRKIFEEKGFKGQLLEDAVAVIIADKKRWVDEMMLNEHQIIEEQLTPLAKAIATFYSFVAVGTIPLLPYLFYGQTDHEKSFFRSAFFTGISFLLIGFLKSKVNQVPAWRAIAETTALGISAAVVAYYTGEFLRTLF